jgi:hypothetical protein
MPIGARRISTAKYPIIEGGASSSHKKKPPMVVTTFASPIFLRRRTAFALQGVALTCLNCLPQQPQRGRSCTSSSRRTPPPFLRCTRTAWSSLRRLHPSRSSIGMAPSHSPPKASPASWTPHCAACAPRVSSRRSTGRSPCTRKRWTRPSSPPTWSGKPLKPSEGLAGETRPQFVRKQM